MARWGLALQPYKFTIEHIAGNKLTAAYGLSRHLYDEPTNLENDEELQEDSFIAHIDPNIFEPEINDKLHPTQCRNQWHVLTIDTADSDIQNTQLSVPTSESEDDDKSDAINKQLIDLWSSQGQDLSKVQHESKDLPQRKLATTFLFKKYCQRQSCKAFTGRF